jgi:hypothetical protein
LFAAGGTPAIFATKSLAYSDRLDAVEVAFRAGIFGNP